MAFLTLFAAWAIAVMSPGPDFLAVVRAAAAHGRRRGVVTGLGVVTGIACWATVALTGLSLLLARYAQLYAALRLVGALFLVAYGLYVVGTALRHRPGEASSGATLPSPGGHPFRLGLATNLANPKAVLFFGALFAGLLPPHLSVPGKVGVVAVMLVMATGWFSLVAALAGSARVMSAYRRAERTVDVVAGAVFVVIGLVLIPR